MRQALELSMTRAPASANRGACARLPVAPAERAVANRRSSRMGKPRSARISRMTVPTWPVAPTTATESPESEMRVMANVLSVRGWRSPSLPGLLEGERVPAAGLVERPRRQIDAVRTDGGDAYEQRQRRVAVR